MPSDLWDSQYSQCYVTNPVQCLLPICATGLGGLHGWQWLFLLEGIPSVILGVVLWFVLPECPAEAKWLKGDNRELLQKDVSSTAEAHLLSAFYCSEMCEITHHQLQLPSILSAYCACACLSDLPVVDVSSCVHRWLRVPSYRPQETRFLATRSSSSRWLATIPWCSTWLP